jgi:hypothetical protein
MAVQLSTNGSSPSSMAKNAKASVYEPFWWIADVAVLVEPGLQTAETCTSAAGFQASCVISATSFLISDLSLPFYSYLHTTSVHREGGIKRFQIPRWSIKHITVTSDIMHAYSLPTAHEH